MNPNFALAAQGNRDLENALNFLLNQIGTPQTTGNTYVLLPTTNANYVQFYKQFQKTYSDGTQMIQPTFAAAIAACTSGRGDVIYFPPGYTRTITGAAGVVINKTNVTLIGLGTGRNRPTISYSTSTAASFDITAANVTIVNFVFNLTGINALIAGVNITAADVSILNCEFVMQSSTTSPALGILTAATAARLRVENCRFIGLITTSGGTLAACIQHEVGINAVIKNNEFYGKMTQAILNATAVLGILIDGNRIQVYTGTKGIALNSGTSGAIVNNRIIVPSGTAPTVAVGATHIGNVYGTEALTIGTPTAAAF